jgi:hypothetical protein
MSGGVKVTGLTELLKAMTDAPKEIREQGMVVVKDETEQAARDYISGLPRVTGHLQNNVKTTYPAASSILLGIVRSSSPHSHLVEKGTKQRRTSGGANRGVMPRIPAAERMSTIAPIRRARMYRRLADILVRMGFEVSGV